MVEDDFHISISDLRQVLVEWFRMTSFRDVATIAANDIVTMCFSKMSGSDYPLGQKYETIVQGEVPDIRK